MLKLHGLALLVSVVACLTNSCRADASGGPASRPAVVVELFTSEGCSSCPPADAVLADLAEPNAVDGIDVVPLAMHVDYWNSLGWTDRFSSPAFSARQQQYSRWFNADQVYTPQMIVDGTEQFVGSSKRAAVAAIRNASIQVKGHIRIRIAQDSTNEHILACDAAVDGIGAVGNSGADLFVALTEAGLSSDVRRGENAGRTLRHAAVVRSLRRIATLRATDKMPFSASTKLELQPGWRTDHLNLAIFVQDAASGRILAAGQQRLSDRGGKAR